MNQADIQWANPKGYTPTKAETSAYRFGFAPNETGGYNYFYQQYNPRSGIVAPYTGNLVPITREQYTQFTGLAAQTDKTPEQIAQEKQDAATKAAYDAVLAQQRQQEEEKLAQQRQQEEEKLAQQRKQEEEKAGVRTNIRDLIGKAGNIYKNLYGGLETQAAGKKGELQTQYGTGVEQLGKTYTQQMPTIGQAYAARGAYDSTWRAGAEQQAQTGYEKQLSDLAQAYKESLGKLGQSAAETRASYAAGESGLQNILNRLASETDINQLNSLRNQVENKIVELTQSQAGQLTTEQQLAQAANIPGLSDKFTQAAKTVQTIIQGQAPAMLKKSIATQIVSTSDLTDQEKKQLQSQIDTIA